MTIHPTFKTALFASLLTAVLAAPAFAQDASMMAHPVQPQYAPSQPGPSIPPQPQQEPPLEPPHKALEQHQEGNVTYISGGIGDAEKEQLNAEKQNYNFRMINSDPTGHYTADVGLTIESRDGREVIRVAGAGPLFYAQLPPGSYRVTAVSGGQEETRNVKVSAGTPTDVHLVWK